MKKNHLIILLSYSLTFIPGCKSRKFQESKPAEVTNDTRAFDYLIKNGTTEQKNLATKLKGYMKSFGPNDPSKFVVVNKKEGQIREATVKDIAGTFSLPENEELFLGTKTSQKLIGMAMREAHGGSYKFYLKVFDAKRLRTHKELKVVNAAVLTVPTGEKTKLNEEKLLKELHQLNSLINNPVLEQQVFGTKVTKKSFSLADSPVRQARKAYDYASRNAYDEHHAEHNKETGDFLAAGLFAAAAVLLTAINLQDGHIDRENMIGLGIALVCGVLAYVYWGNTVEHAENKLDLQYLMKVNNMPLPDNAVVPTHDAVMDANRSNSFDVYRKFNKEQRKRKNSSGSHE